jgi:hypothetical protein
MDFLTPELLRILKPGPHLLLPREGPDQLRQRDRRRRAPRWTVPRGGDLPRKHGFDYMGMITVITDVVRENNQTYRLGYTEMCKDGTKMGVGCRNTCCCSKAAERPHAAATPTSRW